MRTQMKMARAVGSEFVGRQIRSTWWIAAIIAAVAIAGSVWLTTLSAWWWILAVVVMLLSFLTAFVYMVAALMVYVMRPGMNEAQTEGISGFVDKLERMLENVGTPWFIIPFYVAYDVLRGKKDGFIQTVIDDSSGLRADFRKLRKLFASQDEDLS